MSRLLTMFFDGKFKEDKKNRRAIERITQDGRNPDLYSWNHDMKTTKFKGRKS